MKKFFFLVTLFISTSLYSTFLGFNVYAAEEKYFADPYHTNVTWKVSHFGFSSPSGKFTSATGYLILNEKKLQQAQLK